MAQKFYKYKVTTLLCVIATFILIGSCPSLNLRRLPADSESPGRLKTGDLPKAFSQFNSLCYGEFRALPCEVLPYDHRGAERIGHVIGAYQEYTMKLTEKGPLTRKNVELFGDAVSLMKTAFEDRHLDAVELDVHVNREKQNEINVFILHYEPPWPRLFSWPASRQFIENPRNTLGGLLDEFFPIYANQKKRLYIELKAPKPCRENGASPADACNIVATRVAAVFRERTDALNKNQGSVAFVSFSSQMLEAMYYALSDRDLSDSLDFILILGPSSKFVASFASFFKGWVPEFNGSAIEWLKRTPWLSGIWYSPKANKNLPSQISKINRQRINAGASCLFVGISTYQQKLENFMKSTKDSWKSLPADVSPCDLGKEMAPAVVRSFIFDIDSK